MICKVEILYIDYDLSQPFPKSTVAFYWFCKNKFLIHWNDLRIYPHFYPVDISLTKIFFQISKPFPIFSDLLKIWKESFQIPLWNSIEVSPASKISTFLQVGSTQSETIHLSNIYHYMNQSFHSFSKELLSDLEVVYNSC